MATRKIKDAKDLNTGELIYFKGHAKATYLSDGKTIEEVITEIDTKIDNAISSAITNELNSDF